jgi:hypothetical protein
VQLCYEPDSFYFYSEVAKKLLSDGKKQQALIALKKKKLQEVHLARSQAQLDNVSTLIDSVEFAQIEVKVFDALKAGNVALGQLHDAIGGVEAVEELLLDTEDAIARQNEIEEVYDESIAKKKIESLTWGVVFFFFFFFFFFLKVLVNRWLRSKLMKRKFLPNWTR